MKKEIKIEKQQLLQQLEFFSLKEIARIYDTSAYILKLALKSAGIAYSSKRGRRSGETKIIIF